MTKKITDEEFIAAYEQTGSVWKAAKLLGTYGQKVHRALKRLEYPIKSGILTEDQKQKIESHYAKYTKNGELKLKSLAEEMGVHHTTICSYAKTKGLTSYNRPMANNKRDNLRNSVVKSQKKNGHPRGMLGKKHSEETLKVLSERSKENNAKMTPEQKSSAHLKALKTKEKKYGAGYFVKTQKTTWKQGWREIGGVRKYYRSRWEANYARYLEWLLQHGEIKKWEHEPKTFWFEGIMRGTRSYLPDFRVTLNDGSIEYHEVKGWMNPKSKTKLKRMAKYHPDVKIVLIDTKPYRAIEKQLSKIIPDWEHDK